MSSDWLTRDCRHSPRQSSSLRAGTMTVSSISSSGSGWSKTVPGSGFAGPVAPVCCRRRAHRDRPGPAPACTPATRTCRRGPHVSSFSFASLRLILAHYAAPFFFRPYAPYYKDVRFPRCLILALLLPLGLLPACNRGSHPAQTGKPAPDFTVSDGTSTVHLASYRGQGRPAQLLGELVHARASRRCLRSWRFTIRIPISSFSP